MKKLSQYIFPIIVLIFVMITSWPVLCDLFDCSEPKIDEVYIHKADNPFGSKPDEYVKILDIERNYVQVRKTFVINNKVISDEIDSYPVSYFRGYKPFFSLLLN